MHTPTADGTATGSSIATSNERTPAKSEDKEGELGSSNPVSGSQPQEVDDGEQLPRRATKRSSSCQAAVRYEYDLTPQNLASTRSLEQHQHVTTEVAGQRVRRAFKSSRNSPLEPPVTRSTLSELDIPRIIFNPKLRHDVNFDPDLHFRPNLDGEKGVRKSQRAAEFWNRLRAQLAEFMTDKESFEAQWSGRQWCLPVTLQAIGEILETLVPPEDRPAVEEILNVDWLMHQFSKGVADLEKLAQWLSKTLKSHCAPMRDELVDEMASQLTVGNYTKDIPMLVQGLQALLGVLEAMKLDVANHQIRCLRPLLIEQTVEFEKTFFKKKIKFRRIDIETAHTWFRAAGALKDEQSRRCNGDMWTFVKGFIDLLLPSTDTECLPDTFVFDDERISKLRADILDAVNLAVCSNLFRGLRNKPSLTEASNNWRASSSSTASNTSSLSNSPSNHDFPVSYVSEEANLRTTLVAILDDSHSSNRWMNSSPSIALQILRSCAIPLSFLPKFERTLLSHLSNASSPIFNASEFSVLSTLYSQLDVLIARYTSLSSTQLFEAATGSPPRVLQSTESTPPSPYSLDEVSKQIAHISVLHWRVWAPLAYLIDLDTNLLTPNIDEPLDSAAVGASDASLETEIEGRRSVPRRRDSLSESISAEG